VASDIAGAAGDQDRHDGNLNVVARMKCGAVSPRGNTAGLRDSDENPVSGVNARARAR
jgi:hypothetical protein